MRTACRIVSQCRTLNFAWASESERSLLAKVAFKVSEGGNLFDEFDVVNAGSPRDFHFVDGIGERNESAVEREERPRVVVHHSAQPSRATVPILQAPPFAIQHQTAIECISENALAFEVVQNLIF